MIRAAKPLRAEPPPLNDKPAEIADMPFETALAELEAIVDRLEKCAVALEDSIQLYTRGKQLEAHCESLIKNAEMRIEKIALSGDGKPKGVQPLDGV